MEKLKIILCILVLLIPTCCKKSNMFPTENIIENEPINELVSTEKCTFEPINEPIKHTFEIEYSKFPLPDKYRGIISSGDKLRDSITDLNSGGQITTAVYHNSLDIPVPDKTPIYACKSGYVKNVYPSYYNGSKWKGHPTYGGYIEIMHYDHTKSIYAHLSFTEVKEGVYVEQGQEIGWSGGVRNRRGSGVSTGPHLHWSVMLDLESNIEH